MVFKTKKSPSASETKKIAATILSQISRSCSMACGIRDIIYFQSGQIIPGYEKLPGIMFVVGRTKNTKIIVFYDKSFDLYSVSYIRIKPKTLDFKILALVDQVYASDLSEIIYKMVNK